jgi:hypothetical protein
MDSLCAVCKADGHCGESMAKHNSDIRKQPPVKTRGHFVEAEKNPELHERGEEENLKQNIIHQNRQQDR